MLKILAYFCVRRSDSAAQQMSVLCAEERTGKEYIS